MEKSFLRTSQQYIVRSFDGAYEHDYKSELLSTTKQYLDVLRENEIIGGNTPSSWLIVFIRSNTIYKTDMNGKNPRFHFRSTTEETIGIYEDGVITFFDGREPMK